MLIRYSRACSHYHDFLQRCVVRTEILLKQGYVRPRLQRAFKKFCGRHYELVKRYTVSICQITKDIFSSMSMGDVYTFWISRAIALLLAVTYRHFCCLFYQFYFTRVSVIPILKEGYIMTGAACGAGNAFPTEAPDFTSSFYMWCPVTLCFLSFICCVLSFHCCLNVWYVNICSSVIAYILFHNLLRYVDGCLCRGECLHFVLMAALAEGVCFRIEVVYVYYVLSLSYFR